jgi:copper resistance protein C
LNGILPRSAVAAVVLMMISASVVAAHVELISSTPAAGENLLVPPTTVTIAFDDELDPDLSGFTVIGPGSAAVGMGVVDLTVADRNVLTGAVVVTIPGIYTVSYRVAGIDGHQLEGAFSFGYQATTTIPGATSNEGPDTAVRSPQHRTGLILLGTVVLLISGTLAVRRPGRQ